MISVFGGSIEEYDVFEELGRGGFGIVQRAKCHNTHKDVAIKKINKNSLIDEKFIERVRQEVSIHSKLDHPSILKLYTFFEDEDFVYMVLELCLNGHIDQWIKRLNRPFYEKEAQDYLAQIVDGMLYLHSRGIMHRDLTLTNLLLDSKWRIKIADFGLATQLRSPEEKHMTMCGTPNYISPEVASRKSHGLESDVWNFGCLVYTMLVGKPPFEANFVRATLNNVLYGNYKFPSHLSENARNLISCCLRRNPKERIKLIDVLRHSFFDSLHEGRNQSNVCRSDSGVYTISTNGTTQHTRTHLSAVGECDEFEVEKQSSTKGSGSSNCHSLLNSPPVRLRANTDEQFYQNEGAFGDLKKQFSGLPQLARNDTFSPHGNVHLVKNNPWSYNHHRVKSSHLHYGAEGHYFRKSWEDGVRSAEDTRGRKIKKDDECCKRRSLSSESQHILNEWEKPRESAVVRTNSLDRFKERDKSGALPGHPLKCRCSACLAQRDVSCGNSSKMTHKSSTSSSEDRNAEILKDITPFRRPPSPPPTFSDPLIISRPPVVTKNSETGRPSPTLHSQCSPLSTRRLRPTRQQTKNVILNILDDGDVCVEFLQQRKRNQKRIFDVCRISHDGHKISLYKPNSSEGLPITETPTAITVEDADITYNYDSLPQKYWKKYVYAARFVKLVKAKTPKMTYYSDQAKCFLMENSPHPDFETLFFSGEKILLSRNVLHITCGGEKTSLQGNEEEVSQKINSGFRSLYKHALEMKQHCLMLEDVLTKLENSSGIPNFPVIIGRRPSTVTSPNDVGRQKENFSPLSVQSSRIQSAVGHLGPFEGSVNSVVISDSCFSKPRKPLTPSQDLNILNNQNRSQETEVIIQNIGTAFKDNKRIGVNYLDGTSLEVTADEPSYMIFTDSTDQKHLYHKDAVPDSLLKKLRQFNEAILKLNPQEDSRVNKLFKPELFPSKKPLVINSGSSHLPRFIR